MNILITGAGGFIGSHLLDSQLALGHHVRAVDLHVDRLHHLMAHPRLEIVAGDLCDANLLRRLVEGVDVVYHLASAHLDVSLSEDDYRRVNVGATVALLQSAARANVSRFVHCSSVGVIGNIKNPPADEQTSCHPSNVYELTKLEGELAALAFASRNRLHVVVARPSWVYGPRCERTRKLMNAVARKRFIIFGSGRNLRHPLYISDAIRGLESCAEAHIPSGELYILAGERAVTVRELLSAIAAAHNVAPPALHLPLIAGQLAGQSIEFAFGALRRRPPFSSRTLDFFTKNNAYNTAKAQRELDFCATVDLRTGLDNTVRYNAGLPASGQRSEGNNG